MHLREQRIGIERSGAGRAQYMLRQHVQRTGLQTIAIQFTGQDSVTRGGAFQNLKTVGWHQQRGTWLIQPVIGTADALHQAGSALGRADADHLVHRTPVDAQIERGSADHGAQAPLGHGGFHLAALLQRQAAVMQRDGQVGVIDRPQFLEGAFGLAAGVDEDERRLRGLDRRHHIRHGMARQMT